MWWKDAARGSIQGREPAWRRSEPTRWGIGAWRAQIQESDCSDEACHRNQSNERKLHELALRIPSLNMSEEATIDHGDGRKAGSRRGFDQAVLPPLALEIADHLAQGRLTDIDHGRTAEMVRRDLQLVGALRIVVVISWTEAS